jgi:hypothetical protein
MFAKSSYDYAPPPFSRTPSRITIDNWLVETGPRITLTLIRELQRLSRSLEHDENTPILVHGTLTAIAFSLIDQSNSELQTVDPDSLTAPAMTKSSTLRGPHKLDHACMFLIVCQHHLFLSSCEPNLLQSVGQSHRRTTRIER